MADEKIKKAPTARVGALSLLRENGTHVMKASWSIPDRLKNGKYSDRATGLEVQFTLNCQHSDGKTKLGNCVFSYKMNMASAGKNVDLNNLPFKISGHAAKRTDFFPGSESAASQRKVVSVTVSVRGYNAKGNGPWATSTYSFQAPNPPSISSISHDEETGVFSTTITSEEGYTRKDRWLTEYATYVRYSYDCTVKGVKYKKDTWVKANSGRARALKKTVSVDIPNRSAVPQGQYVEVKFQARTLGYAGGSGSLDKVERVRRFGYPGKCSIGAVNDNITSTVSTARFSIPITLGARTTRVKLYVLKDVDYTGKAGKASAAASQDWVEIGQIDNGDSTFLSATVEDCQSETPGKHSWIRLKAWCDFEDQFYVYSEPVELTKLYVAPDAVGSIEIISLEPGDDGKSARIHVGWNKDGHDTEGSTEVSWSETLDSWESTDPPETFELTWKESGDYESFHSHAYLTVKGLSEGVTYWFKARRMQELDSGTTYSEYSGEKSVVTTSTPSEVLLSAPPVVPNGSDLPLKWAFNANSQQRGWRVCMADGTVLAQGDDAMGACSIPWGRIVDLLEMGTSSSQSGLERQGQATATLVLGDEVLQGADLEALCLVQSIGYTDTATFKKGISGEESIEYPRGDFGTVVYDGDSELVYTTGAIASTRVWTPIVKWTNNYESSIQFYVSITTGGGWVDSDLVTVSFHDVSTGSLDVPATCTALPFSVGLLCSAAASTARVRVESVNVTSTEPDGTDTQPEGDSIVSEVVNPTWTEGEDGYESSYELPTSVKLVDGGTYRMTVAYTDEEGLTTDEYEGEFTVDWARKAPAPGDDEVTITGISEADEGGVASRYARIVIEPSDSIETGDTYELYRLTPEGVFKIAENREVDEELELVDMYAPYGRADLAYRVAIRTLEGSVEWADYAYELPCDMMRFDFGTQSLELPYNLKIGDSYEKDSEVRTHLDGSKSATWNAGTSRKASLSTDVIKFRDSAQAVAARDLAKYAGPVFVRLPDGSAYAADVNSVSVDLASDSAAVAMAFDAEEVDMSDIFRIPEPESE